MAAFVEWLWCPSGIVREGDKAKKYGDPYDFAMVVAVPWRSVWRWLTGRRPVDGIIKALVKPEGCEISLSRTKDVMNALLKFGIRGRWERKKVPPAGDICCAADIADPANIPLASSKP